MIPFFGIRYEYYPVKSSVKTETEVIVEEIITTSNNQEEVPEPETKLRPTKSIDMKDESKTEVFITGHINVSQLNQLEAQWIKLWGVLAGGKLTLSDSKTSERPKIVVKVENTELQPAVKETGRILAFKIVDKEETLVVLEPLNISDMGRWVSSLFAAIQGLANYQLAIEKYEKEAKAQPEAKENDTQSNERKRFASQTSMPQDIHYSVKVKELAKIFEELSSTNEAKKEGNVTVKRSISSLNIAIKFPSVAVTKPRVVEVINKEEVTLAETMPDITDQLPITEPSPNAEINQDETALDREKIISHQGSYMNQESEKLVLSNLMNPVLAKKRYEKQKQLIQRLEVTMKTVVEQVKRQQKSLEETEASIKELESQSTTSDDYDDVAKLREQKANLQDHILQSETNIEDYKASIQAAEEELQQLSKVISENQITSTVKTYEHVTVIKNQMPVSASIYSVNDDHEEIHQTNHVTNSFTTEIIINKNEPEWIAKARQKSEAIQRLAEEGMLN